MAYLKKGDPLPKRGKGAKLSDKMRTFIDEYMISKNATDAVRKSGYKTKNPNRLASELLRHPLVSEEIEKRMDEKQDRVELRGEYLVNKLVDIIENGEERTADKLRAIELAGKTLALWRDKQEISGPDGGAIELEKKKIEEDVSDFTSRISRLAKRNGTGGISEFPKPGSESEA